MARYQRGRSKVGTYGTGRTKRRSSARKSGRGSYSKPAPRKRSGGGKRRSSAPRAAKHQTVRIVLETAGAQPVREGEAVGIGQKVAKAPRVKPRF